MIAQHRCESASLVGRVDKHPLRAFYKRATLYLISFVFKFSGNSRMIKQISLIALVVAIGIGTLSLGTSVFATVQAGCTGNPHVKPHVTDLPGTCPGQK